ncbi:MAG: DUF268 domain-containing protein [Cytophagaceae bacterium]|nr:DUF268 domain-containing protein [Cytophagaceae bacterium]
MERKIIMNSSAKKKNILGTSEKYVYQNIAKDINEYKKPLSGKVKDIAWKIYYGLFGKNRRFHFNNKTYTYFFHSYNSTWRNERVVEIPIIQEIIKTHQGKNILELGNVLSHYFKTSHLVVDKYESGNKVINQDILDFNTEEKFDIIISISTIEHIGWDEKPEDPKKILRTFEKLKQLLSPGGKIYFTVPLGYNPHLDDLIKNNKITLKQIHYLQRQNNNKIPGLLQNTPSYNNFWKEVKLEEIKELTYGHPFPHANIIAFGVI